MAYYECLSNNDHINIGDNFIVSLSGSLNQITTVCLLGDVSLGLANWSTACSYAWNYSVNIKGKEYTGMCRIPTHQQIYSKCATHKRDFSYWTSTRYSSTQAWYVGSNGCIFYYDPNITDDTLPFIEIIL